MANQQGIGPGGVLLAFIAGAAAGAAVALLYAPASGEDAREFVSQRAREGRERAAEAARQGRDLVKRQRDNVATAFEQAREEALGATDDRGGDKEQDA
jgi:gas vesicle protein